MDHHGPKAYDLAAPKPSVLKDLIAYAKARRTQLELQLRSSAGWRYGPTTGDSLFDLERKLHRLHAQAWRRRQS